MITSGWNQQTKGTTSDSVLLQLVPRLLQHAIQLFKHLLVTCTLVLMVIFSMCCFSPNWKAFLVFQVSWMPLNLLKRESLMPMLLLEVGL